MPAVACMPEFRFGLAWLLLAAPLLAPTTALADLRPFTARYEVLRGGEAAGDAEVTLAREGDDWVLETRTRGTAGMAALVGLEVDERSRFALVEGLPEARSYRYRQRAALRSRERSVEVDPASNRIVSTDRDRRYELAYRPGVLDRHLVALALGQHLLRGERGPFELQVADREKLGPQRYRIESETRITVPEGEHEAVELLRLRDAGSDRSTRYWLDRERGITLRMEQTERRGERLELRLTAYRAGR